MPLNYDPDADALYIKLTEFSITDTEEAEPGLMIDYDANHQVVGIEILRASKLINGTSRSAATRTPQTEGAAASIRSSRDKEQRRKATAKA